MAKKKDKKGKKERFGEKGLQKKRM